MAPRLPCSAAWALASLLPYKGVVTPGWTLDEKGQAMSEMMLRPQIHQPPGRVSAPVGRVR